jgi:16S rRNA (guanine1207-N2)-methyltransferase
MTIEIYGTKQREETCALIAKSWLDANDKTFITIIQKNDWGGKTLERELLKYFPNAQTDSKQKSRFITLTKTTETPDIIRKWDQWNNLSLISETGFYSMPGLFGWNKIDKGSHLLIKTIPNLHGLGADFGCGYGYLSREILDKFSTIAKLHAIDIDPRAVKAIHKNINDPRCVSIIGDCTQALPEIQNLDFIITNPPFHNHQGEDRTMGQRFIEMAYQILGRKGVLWIVANKHMPYEDCLKSTFGSFETILIQDGFKILKALK